MNGFCDRCCDDLAVAFGRLWCGLCWEDKGDA